MALIIASGLFMENLDATVLTTALPTIARDFGVSAPSVSIAVTSYLLALAVFVPASGAFADRFGPKNIFRAAIVLFVLGSMSCGFAGSLTGIAISRFVQGVGGAMMVPVGRLILLRSVEKRDMVRAQSWLLMPGLLGTISGPPVGGLIVTYLDWRWIFWLNVPIGLAGLMLVTYFIPNSGPALARKFDLAGFVYGGAALALTMVGLEMAGPAGHGSAGWLLVALGLGTSMIYLRHAARTEFPLLDVSLVRFDTFRLSLIGGSLTRITHGAQSFLLALMLQLGFGLSAAQSGCITLATAVGTFAMKGVVARVIERVGFRGGLIRMGILGAATYATCGFFRPNWPIPVILAVLVTAGFFMSFQFTAYNTLAYDEIPADRMSQSTSFYATFQQISLALGICVAATVLQVALQVSDRTAPTLQHYSIAFWVVTAISLCSIVPNLRFRADAGVGFAARA